MVFNRQSKKTGELGHKNTIQYNTVQYSTIQYSTVQHTAAQCRAIQYNTERQSPVESVDANVGHFDVDIACHCQSAAAASWALGWGRKNPSNVLQGSQCCALQERRQIMAMGGNTVKQS